MEYIWFSEGGKLLTDGIQPFFKSILGSQYKGYTHGQLVVDPGDPPYIRPVWRYGIKIEVDKALTASQLLSLNKKFIGFQRDYEEMSFQVGETRDLEAEMDELKTEVLAFKVVR